MSTLTEKIYLLLFTLVFMVTCNGLNKSTTLENNTHFREYPELGRMWTFENPPLTYLEKKYGFKPGQDWLDSLRLGSLRLGGEDVGSGFGSAAFVSPNGLIITSNRCVRKAVAIMLDSAGPARGEDPLEIFKTGFAAKALGEETRLRSGYDEWLTAAQLRKITNVTERVDKGVTPGDNAMQIKEKRDANKKMILDEASKAEPDLVAEIVSLYQSGIYQLYQYKVYTDIRLVCIPHLQTAHFGGNEDNFNYPRYNLDFAFIRAYEDDKPANTSKHHFRWKAGGAKKNELVFVSGNPGTTKRLFTKAQLELERDLRIPMNIEQLTNRLRISKDRRGNSFTGEFDPENPSKYWAGVRTNMLKMNDD